MKLFDLIKWVDLKRNKITLEWMKNKLLRHKQTKTRVLVWRLKIKNLIYFLLSCGTLLNFVWYLFLFLLKKSLKFHFTTYL